MNSGNTNTYERKCFVIMPFSKELKYFYYFIKYHLGKSYNITCERADDQKLTIPVLEKIKKMIQNADFIIADCTGRNANVFYELGIAHSIGKDVILITGDAISEVPSDIKHYELIRYQLENDKQFLSDLGDAIYSLTSQKYEEYYKLACSIFDEFSKATDCSCEKAPQDEFIEALIQKKTVQDLPSLNDPDSARTYLLPLIIKNPIDVNTMEQMSKWTFQGPKK